MLTDHIMLRAVVAEQEARVRRLQQLREVRDATDPPRDRLQWRPTRPRRRIAIGRWRLAT